MQMALRVEMQSWSLTGERHRRGEEGLIGRCVGIIARLFSNVAAAVGVKTSSASVRGVASFGVMRVLRVPPALLGPL
jgi:hypothetical protein